MSGLKSAVMDRIKCRSDQLVSQQSDGNKISTVYLVQHKSANKVYISITKYVALALYL